MTIICHGWCVKPVPSVRRPQQRHVVGSQICNPISVGKNQPSFHISTDPGRDFLQYEVVRNLSQEVSSIENGVDLVELSSLEAQLLSHSGNICVVQIPDTVSVVINKFDVSQG